MSPNVVLGLVIRMFGLWVISRAVYDLFYTILDTAGYMPDSHFAAQSLCLFAFFYGVAGLLIVKCADRISAFAYDNESYAPLNNETSARTEVGPSTKKAMGRSSKINWNSRAINVCGLLAIYLGAFSFCLDHIYRYLSTGSLAPTNISVALEAGITAQIIAGGLALCIACSLKKLEERITQIERGSVQPDL